MKAPLTSLCPIDWLVFADYSAEMERPKAEGFARKTAKSLQKFIAAGVEPKTVLGLPTLRQVGTIYEHRSVGIYTDMEILHKWMTEEGRQEAATTYYTNRFLWDKIHWVSTNRLKKRYRSFQHTPLLLSVADLPQKLWASPLAWKFFRVLNRRASGINDKVLNATDPGV